MHELLHQRMHSTVAIHEVLDCICRAGIVTKAMLETPKKQFLLIGALEAAAQTLGLIGAAKLPGDCQPSASHCTPVCITSQACPWYMQSFSFRFSCQTSCPCHILLNKSNTCSDWAGDLNAEVQEINSTHSMRPGTLVLVAPQALVAPQVSCETSQCNIASTTCSLRHDKILNILCVAVCTLCS